MRRSFMISLVLLPAMVLISIVALTTSTTSTRDRINNALYTYLKYRVPFSASIDLIEQIVPAASPRNFMPQMSKGTLGYLNNDFQRTFTNTAAWRTTAWYTMSWLSPTSPVTGLVAFISPWPLAYPPTDVWCVRLQPNGDFYPTIVFVALHEDDYHSEWIVHDPSAENSTELTADLVKLGCSKVENP